MPQETEARVRELIEEVVELTVPIEEVGIEDDLMNLGMDSINSICEGVVVVEAGERSGSLITADFALQQGREVFAVPGNIDSANSAGTNRLIKEGAKMVTGVADVLEEFEEFKVVMDSYRCKGRDGPLRKQYCDGKA